MSDYKHAIKPFSWESIDSGEVLRKFTAIDEGGPDFTVEIHGVFDSQGRCIVLEEIVKRDKLKEIKNES